MYLSTKSQRVFHSVLGSLGLQRFRRKLFRYLVFVTAILFLYPSYLYLKVIYIYIKALVRSDISLKIQQQQGLDTGALERPRNFTDANIYFSSKYDLSFNRNNLYTAPLFLRNYGILFCWIPKASCTKVKHLFLRLAGDPNWNTSGFDPHNYNTKYMKSMLTTHVNVSLWDFGDPLMKRVALIREPLDRFASGYLDIAVRRCFFKKDNGQCYGTSAQDIAAFLRSKQIWAENVHFSPQINFCGFWKLLDSPFWNIVIHDSDRIDEKLMEATGHRLDYAISRGWPQGGLFDTVPYQATGGTSKSEEFWRSICMNEKIFSEVIDFCHPDYKAFGMNPPVYKKYCSTMLH